MATGSAMPERVAMGLQALDILLRHDPNKIYKAYGQGGRRFFDPE